MKTQNAHQKCVTHLEMFFDRHLAELEMTFHFQLSQLDVVLDFAPNMFQRFVQLFLVLVRRGPQSSEKQRHEILKPYPL